MAVDLPEACLLADDHTAPQRARGASRARSRRFTIGVFGNRQVYTGATIVRYEQILFRGIRAAARAYGCNVLLACGVGPDTVPFESLPAWIESRTSFSA